MSGDRGRKGVVQIAYNPDCPICRFSAWYGEHLLGKAGFLVQTYGWRENSDPPNFISEHYGRSENIQYAPYVLLTDDAGTAMAHGDAATTFVHELAFGQRVGQFIGKSLALPAITVLFWLRRRLS